MPLINCSECGNEISDKATACPHCGHPMTTKTETETAAIVTVTPRSRGVFIVLGIFLGFLGIHNFYAGFYGQATTQLILGLITLMLPLILFFISAFTGLILFIWIIADLLMTTHDASGLRLA